VLFVWPFIADTAMTFLKRLWKRERVFEPHRTHIYQLLAATWPKRSTGHWVSGLVYGGLAMLGVGLHFSEGPFWSKLAVLAGLWTAVVGWTVLRMMEPEKDGGKLDNTLSK